MPKFFLGHFRRKVANAALDFKLFDHFIIHLAFVYFRLLRIINSPLPEKTARIIEAIMGLKASSNTIEVLVICGIPTKSISILNAKSKRKRIVIRFIYIAPFRFQPISSVI